LRKLENYGEAEKVCNLEYKKSEQTFVPTLASIKTASEQQFLTEYIFNISGAENNIWLGAERIGDENEFLWNDGSSLDYSNWAEGSPTNDSRRNCLIILSGLAYGNSQIGKWKDITCASGNWILCQKLQIWSFPQLQKSFLDSRNEFKDTKLRLSKVEIECQNTKNELEKTASDLSEAKHKLTNTVNELKFYKDIQNLMITNHISLEFRGKIFLHPKSRDESKGDFHKCLSVCSKYNATTVKIHSAEENDFFWSFIKNYFNQTRDQAWLGGTIFDPTDNMNWLDNSTVDYINWSPNQPDYIEEKCITMWAYRPGLWNNFFCDNYDGKYDNIYVQYIACEKVL
jgi:hypothetical protein